MKNTRMKQFISGLLTFAMLLTYPSAGILAYAATGFFINFDGTSDKLSTAIIEEASIGTIIVKPDSYRFDATTPFNIDEQGGSPNKKDLFGISTTYRITAKRGSAQGLSAVDADPNINTAKTYILRPNLTAYLTEGVGFIDLKSTPHQDAEGNDDTPPPRTLGMTVKSAKELPITALSNLTFAVITNETESSMPTFGLVTATGDFSRYTGQKLIQQKYDKPQTGSRYTITFTIDVESSPTFTMEFELTGNELLGVGTTFSISYEQQVMVPLTLTVGTPMYAVEAVRDGLKPETAIKPGEPDGKPEAYINLNGRDSLQTITSNFSVLGTVANFNQTSQDPRIFIDWAWQPDDTEYQNSITWKGSGRTKIATVALADRDVRGNLVATPRYKLLTPYNGQTEVVGDAVLIPITILGSGSLPQLIRLTKTIGSLSGTGETKINYLDTAFPEQTNLELYKYNHTTAEDRVPFRVDGKLEFGEGRGRAEKMVISVAPGAVNPEGVRVFLNNGEIPYVFGADIKNPTTAPAPGDVPIGFVANGKGQLELIIDLYYENEKGVLEKSDKPIRKRFVISDSSPRNYAELSEVTMRSPELALLGEQDAELADAYPNGKIPFNFDPGKYGYEQLSVPYKVTEASNGGLIISPRIPDGKGVSKKVLYEVSGEAYPGNSGELNMDDPDNRDFWVPMYLDATTEIILTVTAENGRTQQYKIPINRRRAETISALKSLSVLDGADKEQLNTFLPTQTVYNISVPYSTRWVRVDAKRQSVWSTLGYAPPLQNNPDKPFYPQKWVKLTYPGDPFLGGFAGAATTVQKVLVTAEDISLTNGKPTFMTTYTLNITRKDPSTNNQVAGLVIKDAKGKEIKFEESVTFDKAKKKYKIRIPYSNEALTVEVKPDDKTAQMVKVDLAGTGLPGGQVYEGVDQPVVFELAVPVAAPTEKLFAFAVSVMSEKGDYTTVPYTVEVTRNDPDQDSALTSLTLQDQNKAVLPNFSFNPQTTDYSITVPFRVDTVLTVPVARSPLAKVYVNKQEITTLTPSHALPLKVGQSKQIQVEIHPEDRAAEPRYYNITVTRAPASTDARLKSLVVNGGEEFLPVFASDKLLYGVTIPEGTKSITFTAVPVDGAATLLIDGKAVANGTASAPYEPLDATSKVEILVTAEDGKTTMIYTVTITDRNRIPKGTAADLESLTVNYGSMSPRFKPNILEYDVALKNDTSSVDLLPVPADPKATFKVFAGTKQLGDYRDAYSSIIRDGENPFTVEVTSEDGKLTKTYLMHIYRKDEEQQGVYKPITPDMVDYAQTGDEIVVDISKYAVISADVLNTLRNKYPDKTMVFQGNDYTLSIKGKDLKTLIPHEEVFDFSLTYTAPDEDEIWNIILDEPRNNKIEPVFVHFNHHGALPAPMLLTLSLGREYRNLSATWNYYNEERNRIDYYGGLRTNSRGTFSVMLNHMSTYIFCDDRIVGAEYKGGTNEPGDITGGISSDGGKYNPNTGG